MIDRRLLREQAEKTVKNLIYKDPDFDAERLVSLDADLRRLQHKVEELRQHKNDLAQQGKKGVSSELREKSIKLGRDLKESENALQKVSSEFMDLYLSCPNITFDDVPIGDKSANKVVREVGKEKKFTFEPKHHVDLAVKAGWIDFETAALMTGSQFALYKGDAVKLMYALTMFMLKRNVAHGFTPVIPPSLVNEQSLLASAHFPKFRDQVYEVEKDDLYLIPTAEVSLLNMHRDQIIDLKELPLRMTSWTSCFRREAGGYGASERGLIRMHQFEKVELFTFCKPEQSSDELDRLVSCAEDILKAFGLRYRVTLLATQDCSFPSAKTFDIEVWMPGQKIFSEVSSCSNCTDFQARRGSVRYRPTANAKPQLVHTLNGSSLALSRLMVALIETYQQEDGTIAIPDILKTEGIF